jgi:hypothetical protein
VKAGGLGWGAAMALTVAGCQPITWNFDEPASDGGTTTDATVPGSDAMVARDADWSPPDGCVGDPACLSCTANACPNPWVCNPEVLRCVECSPPRFPCQPGLTCQYGRCLATCNPSAGDNCGPDVCNADHVCVPCVNDQQCRGGSHCTLTGQCVECTSNDECMDKSAAPMCALTGRLSAVLGQCVECVVDGDCEGGSCDSYGHCEHGDPLGIDP